MSLKSVKKLIPIKEKISHRNINNELEESYLSYAMSVIVGRAIPDIRDGLKPVQRRIIYSMYENNNTHDRNFTKCARIVGNVMGHYHPHGDVSIYDSLVRMAQQFTMLIPLIEPQGNFGSIDGDNPAAMRYTEARLSKIAKEMTDDLKYDTVDFIDNFDGSLKEPLYLPTKFPNLLINGANGIAVGMSTNIMPHNLKEVMNAVIEAINVGDKFTWEDVYKHIKGPDFPTGGIIYGDEGIKKYIKTGTGKVTIRAKYHIEQLKTKRAIIITEIPYGVTKSSIIEKIAELASAGKVEGISDLRDESDKNGLRIYIEVRKEYDPDLIMSYLFENTQLEQTKVVQNLVLTHNGLKPEILSVRDIIAKFIEFREQIITRRTQFLLNQAQKRLHLVDGRLIVVQHIEDVINIIKQSTDAKVALQELKKQYKLSDEQAEDILEMKLRQLTKLNINQLIEEQKELQNNISKYKTILSNRNEIRKIIKEESLEIIKNYGKDRRSSIEYKKRPEHDEMVSQIQEVDSHILISESWRIKRIDIDNYNEKFTQIEDQRKLFNENIRYNFYVTYKHSLLIFTQAGMVYSINTKEIPLHINLKLKKDKNLSEFIKIEENDCIADVIAVHEVDFEKNYYLLFLTLKGFIKKTKLSEYKSIRSNGIIAINIKEEDKLLFVKICDDDSEIILKTKNNEMYVYNSKDIKATGRTTRGIVGIKLKGEDQINELIINKLEKKLIQENPSLTPTHTIQPPLPSDHSNIPNNSIEYPSVKTEDKNITTDKSIEIAKITPELKTKSESIKNKITSENILQILSDNKWHTIEHIKSKLEVRTMDDIQLLEIMLKKLAVLKKIRVGKTKEGLQVWKLKIEEDEKSN